MGKSHNGGHPIAKVQREADAHLMTAAPLLLKELRSVLEWATTEKAPLRPQEIASIRAVVELAEIGAKK